MPRPPPPLLSSKDRACVGGPHHVHAAPCSSRPPLPHPCHTCPSRIPLAPARSCSKLRVCKLGRDEAEQFYEVHRGKPFFPKLTEFMSSGRICAIELLAPGAIRKWRELIGPTDSNKVSPPCRAAAGTRPRQVALCASPRGGLCTACCNCSGAGLLSTRVQMTLSERAGLWQPARS